MNLRVNLRLAEALVRTAAPVFTVCTVLCPGELEDGTVFDSSESRGAPFGPFVQGRGQIIEGYTQALQVRARGPVRTISSRQMATLIFTIFVEGPYLCHQYQE